MYIYIYLIIVMLKVFNTSKHKDDMHMAIARFVKLKLLLGNGYSPLHMCCDGNTHAVMFLFIENRTWIAVSFPYTVLCKTLISCGAEVNALDNDRNTPLHILAMSAERIHLTIML